MRLPRLLCALFLLSLAACAATADKTPPPAEPGKRHVLLIGIDGLRGDSFCEEGCVAAPTIRTLMQEGAHHRNVLAGGVQKTVSGPGWASVFTGVWADKHGVPDNDEALTLQRPHVFAQIKQAWPQANIGVVGDWYNITHGLLPQGADFVVANGDKDSQEATDTVKGWLARPEAPTAIFYYLHKADVHVCCYDPRNAHYQAMLAHEDAQIRQVLDALAARPTYQDEDWLIVVASDHGGAGKGHGGQTATERATFVLLDNTWAKPDARPYCRGDLSATPMLQIDGATPHILDFFGLPNTTDGRKHPSCGT